jgi:hypothetical protein
MNPESRVFRPKVFGLRLVARAHSFTEMHQAIFSHEEARNEIVRRALTSIADDGMSLYHSWTPHSIIQGAVS